MEVLNYFVAIVLAKIRSLNFARKLTWSDKIFWCHFFVNFGFPTKNFLNKINCQIYKKG